MLGELFSSTFKRHRKQTAWHSACLDDAIALRKRSDEACMRACYTTILVLSNRSLYDMT